MKRFIYWFSLFVFLMFYTLSSAQQLKLGADRLDILLPLIKDQRVGLVVNLTSKLTCDVHLLDTLLSSHVDVVTIFAPEHGFRGEADAGEQITDGKDNKTNISVVSLYGKNYKPSADQLKDVDVLVFDIQDVGTRFYTYISTMHYVMEACAEYGKALIILDRPNPNDYIDGPVLDTRFKSFVGMHPIPVLHGLTIGELAQMIQGEGWLRGGAKCRLTVVPMMGWVHGQAYVLPTKPSPNLPNQQAIALYPSLCFFEATDISVGRGTDFPFQVIGAPLPKYGSFTFTPRPSFGAKNPLYKNVLCHGLDLRDVNTSGALNLAYLIDYYKISKAGKAFFRNPRFMDLLAGTDKLRLQIINGTPREEIYRSWQSDLDTYKTMRKKYVLYNEMPHHIY